MISTKTLLTALQKRVLQLEDDLRARRDAQPEVDALRQDYDAAREMGRTGLTYNAWRDERLEKRVPVSLVGKSCVWLTDSRQCLSSG